MSQEQFLHELSDFDVIIERTARAIGTLEQLVEKDYWIMHCLWGLKQQGFEFELKGGTSLSKGFGIIDRFSEDIDIRIEPPGKLNVKTGKNHYRPNHIASRFKFYDWLADEISVPGITTERDTAFDDKKGRNGGIRLSYESRYSNLEALKPYILLEVGFDLTTPNKNVNISSWAYDEASRLKLELADNRAIGVPCYLPGYTLVEKLSAISTKYQSERTGNIMPINFIRHYYDIYQLLIDSSVQEFIGTDGYRDHKLLRFQNSAELNLNKNEAFILSDKETRVRYAAEYARTRALYYGDFPTFDSILRRVQSHIRKL